MIFGFFKNDKDDRDEAAQSAADSTEDAASLVFQIDGMHCTSCSMNIDGELEDTPGVIRAETSYAQSRTQVQYDSDQVTPEELKAVIAKLGYEVV